MCSLFVFFFKQKTAYEMRISDWSSDVCSSDLLEPLGEHIDERRVDIVDALAVAAQLVVHGSAAPLFFGTLGTGKGAEASRKSLQNRDRGATARRVMTAEIHQLHGQRPPPLDPMMALVAAATKEVHSVLIDRMQPEVPMIPDHAVPLAT